MKAYERLLQYAAIDTQSSEDAETTPSTEKQFVLAKLLETEMKELGMERVCCDEHAYVYGFLPASAGKEHEPAIGLIAHIDTAPDFSGTGVRPQLHKNYDGKPLPLGDSGLILSPEQFPDLKSCVGCTLITTDGITLLGADDKAGVAEIMSACERIIKEKLPHCAISVCFAPDEEIGHGAALLDLEHFGADFAYTFDGDEVNEINFETFNASEAVFAVKGVNVHPGTAKNIMVNASLVAMEINAMLPPEEIPSKTENYEGFFHLTDMSGTVEKAELRYIIRDHDAEKFAGRCEKLRGIEQAINDKYGADTVSLSVREQYRNMGEKLKDRMEIVERAIKAVSDAGLSPVIRPIRGGTDGAQLTFRGLPCPNIGTGGAAFHGPYEHITVEAMDKAVDIILNIAAQ